MIVIRTILCPVNFSDATARQVAVAADLARLYRSRLVLHHNMSGLAVGAGVGWMWSADQASVSQDAVARRLAELAGSSAADLKVEMHITEGPSSSAVLAVSDAVKADLVVLSTGREESDDHTSVTAAVLDRAARPVLVLHQTALELNALRFDPGASGRQLVLVPTPLTAESRAVVKFAFDLAATLPIDLHLLHLLAHGRRHGNHAAEAADAEKKLREMVPPDLVERTHVHVRADDQVHGILRAATDLGAACIVMGEHTRPAIRRWFSTSTSHGVLHDAPCPVWYVPGSTDG